VYIEYRTNAPHAEIDRWLSAFEDRNAMQQLLLTGVLRTGRLYRPATPGAEFNLRFARRTGL
jgi:hypothetical protein